ncbi:11845_t:CDS:2 [Ambispora leptoticha]|uniref:11845_t:CDS:1 n=1 Tax=Ambispora leptoticha TaxID=144679 RepID=A0A9N9BSL5_9GLOM|nr:11845_t:CDS:2 [Ambispora leptoticha]
MNSDKTKRITDEAQYVKGVVKENLGRAIHDEKLISEGTNEKLTKQAEMEAAQKVAVKDPQKENPSIVSLEKGSPKVIKKSLDESPTNEYGKANPVTHQKMKEIDPMEAENSKLKKEESKL